MSHPTLSNIRGTLLATAAIIYVVDATPALAQLKAFDVPAQPAATGIAAFARQADMQLLISAQDAEGMRTNAVTGALQTEDALSMLLAGTGLVAQRAGPHTYTVVRQKPAGEYEAGQGPAGSASAEGDDREIVVTGSIIRGAAPSGANLIVMGREDLDNTGRGTLAEAIQTVPQVHGGGSNDAMTRSALGAAPNLHGGAATHFGAASLNLRGLGVEETLTLVNGRRLAPAGSYGAFADISSLPMSAVERVEILADGASATYGADAMAGVVNIIMNRRFEGAETRLRAGLETRSGQPEFQASQTFGWAFDRGNLLLSADYTRRDGVTARGRPYAASADLRPFGGSDRRQPYCSPGNIVNTPGLNGAIPAGQDGTALTPDQIRSGETNRCDLYPSSSYLTPESEKGSIYLAGSYGFTNRLRLSVDVIATQRSTKNVSEYYYTDLAVPVSNAFRRTNGFHGNTAPLNQNIYLTYQFTEIDPTKYDVDVRSLLASIGANYSLGRDWQLSLTGSYGRYDSESEYLMLDTRSVSAGGALAQALASSDPATAFNPFGDGSTNSRALVESFLYPQHSLQESDYHSAGLTLGGSLVDMPGGALKLAIGGDYRRESYRDRSRRFYANLAPGFQESDNLDADRDVTAAYAELFIPLFSERNAVAGARRLSISLSGRYDHYSDFGDTFNPKAGVTWEPVEGLTIKGSYGTSFKAPLLTSLYGATRAGVFPTSATSRDPDVNGDGSVRWLYVAGGNPDLGPENGVSWTIGAEVEPDALPGLRLYAKYFNLRFTGRFAMISDTSRVSSDPAAYEDIVYFPLPPQSEVDRLIASVAQVVVMPPPGSIEAIIDMRTKNFASQVIDGVDAGVNYHWGGLGGTFNLSGEVSYFSRYKSRLGQSTSVTSYLGNVGLPARWKARGGLGWTGDGVSLTGLVNHTASYTNKMVTPHEPVSSYTTVDLSLQAQLGGWVRNLIGDGAALTFYVTNLFDQAPPFVNNLKGVGYDGTNADPIGRRTALQLTKRW